MDQSESMTEFVARACATVGEHENWLHDHFEWDELRSKGLPHVLDELHEVISQQPRACSGQIQVLITVRLQDSVGLETRPPNSLDDAIAESMAQNEPPAVHAYPTMNLAKPRTSITYLAPLAWRLDAQTKAHWAAQYTTSALDPTVPPEADDWMRSVGLRWIP